MVLLQASESLRRVKVYPGGQMRIVFLVTRVIALFGLMAVALSGCGSSQPAAPTTAVVGPGLLFFYTDN
jgi:hypothetical protein